jgi:twitching motility protein PilT
MAEIDRYLKYAVSMGASDLHIAARTRPMMRLHGTMVPALGEDTRTLPAETMDSLVNEIMSPRAKEELQRSLDTDFAYALPGLGRFRVNVFRNNQGTGAVLRHIPDEIRTFEELKLPPTLSQFCMLNKGLVLVTGPTGSGKSTTLAAMIDYINQHRQDHIITIEDPIEFVHQNKQCRISQREVKEHAQSFERALRAALRQDPDIVLVGEMRDLETTQTAIETAETGHLVFGTLHTSTAASTVERIVDQFPHERQEQIRTMLATSLKGVVCQTLCKRKDGNGRVAAMEIMVVTHGIAANIRDAKTHQIPTAIQTGKRLGMQLLNDDLLRLANEHAIGADEAYLKAMDKSDMASKLRTAGFRVQGVTQ